MGDFFWPEFHLHDDCIFLANQFRLENYDGFLKQGCGDKQFVEKVMNHIHLEDLFACVETEPSHEILIALGEQLREIWEVKLAHDFPNRVFKVVCGFLEGNELKDCQIFFFQPESGKTGS